jgi:DNA topoisomerase-1
MFGDATGARRYATRVKNAQEAHEAIRPSNFGAAPASLEATLDRSDLRVYELIWKRTMASQMVDARVLRTTVEISGAGPNGEAAIFTASGKAIEFAGFRRAYVEGSDDPAAELEEQETVLPMLTVGERVAREPDARAGGGARTKTTTPPPGAVHRSLAHQRVQSLGIGRPSTYASTIGTIERRGYVFRQGQGAVPSFTAFAVTRLLCGHFSDLVDVEFTAEMEEDLDQISRGERDWLDFIREFYRGDKHHRGLEAAVKQAEALADYPLIDVGVDPDSGGAIHVRIGRYGPFLQQDAGGTGKTASLPQTQPPADLTVEKAMALIRAKAEGPRQLGLDRKPACHAIHGHRRRAAGRKRRQRLEGGPGARRSPTADRIDRHAGRGGPALELPRELGRHRNQVSRLSPAWAVRSHQARSDYDRRGRGRPVHRRLDRALLAEEGARRQNTGRVIRQIKRPIQSREVLEGRYGPYVTDERIDPSGHRSVDAVARRRAWSHRSATRRGDTSGAPPPHDVVAAAACDARGRRGSRRRQGQECEQERNGDAPRAQAAGS